MVAQVAQPVLVSLGNEPGRQTDVFRKMMRFTAFIATDVIFNIALAIADGYLLRAIVRTPTGEYRQQCHCPKKVLLFHSHRQYKP